MPVETDPITDPRAAIRVFFDGGCPLCRKEIGWYRGKRGAEQIDWVDVSGDAEIAVPEGLTRQDLMLRFTVQRRDGVTARGASGFVAVWRALPGTAGIARWLDNPVIVGIAEMVYRGMLKVRPLWRARMSDA